MAAGRGEGATPVCSKFFISAAISSVFSPRRWKRKRSKFDEVPMSIDGVIVSATPFGEVVALREEAVEDVVTVGRHHHLVDQEHVLRVVPGEDVAKVAGRHGERHLLPRRRVARRRHAEVRAHVVHLLRQDARGLIELTAASWLRSRNALSLNDAFTIAWRSSKVPCRRCCGCSGRSPGGRVTRRRNLRGSAQGARRGRRRANCAPNTRRRAP